MSQRVAIVGSGFLGMTLALRLAGAGKSVTIFESSDKIGGLASTWKIGDVEWDRHYHVTLGSDRFTRGLIEELGLSDQFDWVETKTGFYTDSRLYSMSDMLEFLRFPPLGLVSKLRLGTTIIYASRQKDWKKLERMPVEDWLTRLSGKTTFDKIWRPLLKAKLGDAYRETSAAFIWATIQRMYAARRSGLKKEMFGYVRGGYATVLRKLGDRLVETGVEVRLQSRIEKIEADDQGRCLVTEAVSENAPTAAAASNGEIKYARVQTAVPSAPGFSSGFLSEPRSAGVASGAAFKESTFDKVILTCPSSVAAKLLPQLTETELAAFENIRYQGIVCASVLMKYPLSRYYVTNITDPAPFTGVIEMSALVDKTEFGQYSLVYLPKYVAPDDEIFESSDDEIRESFLRGLERMYPHFRQKDVVAFQVSRVRQVFPLPVLNYSEHLPATATSVDNVYVVNSSHIVNGTLNINETVQLAERFFEDNFAHKEVEQAL